MLGVEKGIEKVSKILMLVLMLLIIGIGVYTLTLPGAIDGLIYYVKPDLSEFSIKTVIAAMGQLFYSMSLAMGIMITYGSYMRKEDNIEKSVRQIEIFDTLVAFLAGLIIVPAVFVFSGGDRSALNAGPKLMFVTLPNVFDSMSGGQIVGTVFFCSCRTCGAYIVDFINGNRCVYYVRAFQAQKSYKLFDSNCIFVPFGYGFYFRLQYMVRFYDF